MAGGALGNVRDPPLRPTSRRHRPTSPAAMGRSRGNAGACTESFWGDAPGTHGSGPKRLGAFNDLDAAVNAAHAAFEALDGMKLAKRDEIIAAIRKASLRESESLAFAAHKETGFGRYEDKIIKNRLVANKTPGTRSAAGTSKNRRRRPVPLRVRPVRRHRLDYAFDESHRHDHQQHDFDGRGRQRRSVQRSSFGQRMLASLRRYSSTVRLSKSAARRISS